MAIFTGNDLFIGASAKPEEYKKTKANIKSICDNFNFNGYQAKYNENHLSNPGMLDYGYSVHIYKSEYMELME